MTTSYLKMTVSSHSALLPHLHLPLQLEEKELPRTSLIHDTRPRTSS